MTLYRTYRPLFNLIGLVLLIALIVLLKIDLGQTLAYLVHANGLDVGIAVALFVPFIAIKAWRWQIILRDVQVHLPFSESLKLYALGMGAGMITPGQVGDAIKVAYLREQGLGRALLSVLLDRLWDVLVLLLLAATGALLFWHQFESEWLALTVIIVGTLILLGIAASPRAQRALATQWFRFRGGTSEKAAFEPIQLSLSQISRQFALTFLATAVAYVRYYLIASAIGIHLTPIPFVAAMSLASITALIPISVSGVGTRDAALLLIAPVIGISREQALGLSALILFLSVVNGVVGFAVWLSTRYEVESLKSEVRG